MGQDEVICEKPSMMVDGHGHGLFLVMGNLGCHGNKVFVPGERSMDGLGM